MAIKIADSFSLDGSTKPNFARDQFSKLSDMKAYTVCDEGHIAYCLQDGKRYEFKNSNSIDELTGKWREFKVGGGEVTVTPVLNSGTQVATINGVAIYAPTPGSPITGLPASAITYDDNTNYTSGTIGYIVKNNSNTLTTHLNNKNNPHNVTASQIGAYVKPSGGIPKDDLSTAIKDLLDNVVTFGDLEPDTPPVEDESPVINYYTQAESDARYLKVNDSNVVKYEDGSNITIEDVINEYGGTFGQDGISFAAILSNLRTYFNNNINNSIKYKIGTASESGGNIVIPNPTANTIYNLNAVNKGLNISNVISDAYEVIIYFQMKENFSLYTGSGQEVIGDIDLEVNKYYCIAIYNKSIICAERTSAESQYPTT